MNKTLRMLAVFLASDLAALLAALSVGYGARYLTGGNLPPDAYARLLPFMSIFLLLYALLGLYSTVLQPPHEELKMLFIGTSAGCAAIALLIFLTQNGMSYSRFVILATWAGTLVLAPLFRLLARRAFAHKQWWGYPVLLFAHKGQGKRAALEIECHKERGPVLHGVIEVDFGPVDSSGLPSILLDGRDAPGVMRDLKQRYPSAQALIMAGTAPLESLQPLVQIAENHFSRVLIHLDTLWLQRFTLRVSALACGPALLLRQNLLDPTRMRVKRALDLLLCAIGSGVLLIAVPAIALAIRMDSSGPVFFSQKRLGLNGKTIRVFKFRTMTANAPCALEDLLEQNPALREEWKKNQKLANDPRLTRVGRFLRRTSLDELPQIYNVLKGDMSFVGPRPIVEAEIKRYGRAYDMYSRVRPGITGLWQISGRNDTSYAKRVNLDKQYVYNWSVSLDLYIIIRTIPAMLSGNGAY